MAIEFIDLPPVLSATGTVRLAGSKSISNRVLLLAALAEGTTEVRDLLESDDTGRMLEALQALGVTVLYTAGHHRKLAILDRKVVYEGSLNILSFNDSCEIMRKIASEKAAKQLCTFIAIDRYARSK